MDVDLTPFGFAEFTDEMDQMGFRALHPNRAFESIVGDFHRREERAFTGSQLQRTGSTRKSLTRRGFKTPTGRAGAKQGSVVKMSPDRLLMGTNIWYTRFHEDALLRPVASSRRVVEDWLLTLLRYIETGEVPSLSLGSSGQLISVVGL